MPSPSQELNHPIKVVCHRTGLSAHVIRVWERRYGLICCQRTGSNRRLYSDEEIERLRLLKLLTDCGHRISQISCLCLDELYILNKKAHPKTDAAPQPLVFTHANEEECLARCLEAVALLDVPALSDLLESARLRYGQRTTLLRIVAPLVYEVGEAWRKGELRVSHEHLATSVIRDFLAIGARSYQKCASAPELMVATPAGQVHEVGALLVTAIARDLGWQVIYLGPSLPSEEIAACAQARKVRAVALSVVYPSDDPKVPEELSNLRCLLPSHIAMILGGRAAYGYYQALRVPDVQLINGLADLEAALEKLSKTVSSAS